MFEQVAFEHNVSYNPIRHRLLVNLPNESRLWRRIAFDRRNKCAAKRFLESLHRIVRYVNEEYRRVWLLKERERERFNMNLIESVVDLLCHCTFCREDK